MTATKQWRLPQNLKALRLSKGLTLSKLSRVLGYDPSGIATWEQGKANPHLTTALDLAGFYGLTVEELCYGIFIGGGEKCTSTTSESSETR